MGFGDTLVSKTCLFFLGSHVRGGGGGRYIWYSRVACIQMHTHVPYFPLCTLIIILITSFSLQVILKHRTVHVNKTCVYNESTQVSY